MTFKNRNSEVPGLLRWIRTMPAADSSSTLEHAANEWPDTPQEIEPLLRAIATYRAAIQGLDREVLNELTHLLERMLLNWHRSEDWRCTLHTLYLLVTHEFFSRADDNKGGFEKSNSESGEGNRHKFKLVTRSTED